MILTGGISAHGPKEDLATLQDVSFEVTDRKACGSLVCDDFLGAFKPGTPKNALPGRDV